MTAAMLVPLLPLLLPSGMAVVLAVVIAFRRRHGLSAALALAGLGAGLVAIPFTARVEPRRITALLLLDGWALLLLALVLGATIVVTVLAHGYLSRRDGRREELYVLLVLAAVGAGVLVASTHVASFFLGLELLSVSLYALLAYDRASPRGLEAGLKYLVLAASSAAFLLLGLAFLYAQTGTMELGALARVLSAPGLDPLVLAGLVLALLLAAILWLGFFPARLAGIVASAASSMGR